MAIQKLGSIAGPVSGKAYHNVQVRYFRYGSSPYEIVTEDGETYRATLYARFQDIPRKYRSLAQQARKKWEAADRAAREKEPKNGHP